MSRCLDGVAVGLFWRALERRLREPGRPAPVAFVDGKQPPVGGRGRDSDARFGRAAGGVATGPTPHAGWTRRAVPEAGEVPPSNAGQKAVARRLIGRREHGGCLPADGPDDAGDRYDAAFAHG
jgi:hypothetical protein